MLEASNNQIYLLRIFNRLLKNVTEAVDCLAKTNSAANSHEADSQGEATCVE